MIQYENTLNSVGTWWCSDSGRKFQVVVTRHWKDPSYITTGTWTAAETPVPDDDYSYQAYKELLGSLHCH